MRKKERKFLRVRLYLRERKAITERSNCKREKSVYEKERVIEIV